MAATTGKQYSSSVQKKARKAIEKPAYLLESVDNALKLLQMLRDVGALRLLKEAAEELAIAPSTAHRLFAILVYRGFAVQDEKRLSAVPARPWAPGRHSAGGRGNSTTAAGHTWRHWQH